MSIYGNPVMMGGSGGRTIVPKTITTNGIYNASADNADGYNPVVVNVSGGASDIEMQASVVNGEAVTSGIAIVSQPYIVDGEFSATGSAGLQFKSSDLLPSEATIEMDFTPSASGGVLISFGGSNAYTGMLMLTPSLFRWYAQGEVFRESVSLTAGTQYHLKIEINSNTLLLYIDGVLSKTITNSRFASLVAYILTGNIALLYNQSSHSEYSSSKINNLNIKVVMES